MGKTTRRILREKLKAAALERIIAALDGEEILRTNSAEIAFPVVDEEGNEDFIVVTVKVPIGSYEDGQPYDGYAMAEAYKAKIAEREEKRKAAEAAKAKKIAKAEAEKKARAEAKAKRKKAE